MPIHVVYINRYCLGIFKCHIGSNEMYTNLTFFTLYYFWVRGNGAWCMLNVFFFLFNHISLINVYYKYTEAVNIYQLWTFYEVNMLYMDMLGLY